MTASGWREKLTAEASSPGPMVCATRFLWTEGWPWLSSCSRRPTGDKYDGEWKENKQDGRGTLALANGMCHVTPL